MSERWWVLGMGLAACAVLFSGTLVDFITREAMRRSRVESFVMPQVAPAPAPAASGEGAMEKPTSLAVTAQPEDD